MPLIVAPLAAVVVAITALILLYAAYQIFHPLLQGLGQSGGTVGGLIFRFLGSILDSAYNYAVDWARGALHDVIGFILAPVFWVEEHINALTQGLHTLTWLLQWSNSVYLPRQISGALNIANGWVHQAETLAASEFAASQRYALGLYHDAITFTQDGLNRETAYVNTLYLDSIHYTDAQIHAVEGYAQGLYNGSINFTRAAVADAEHYTTTAVAGLETWTAGQITALDKYIATTLPQVYAYTDAAVKVVELDLAKLKTECTDNLCSNLGGLANLFNALSGVVSATMFIEMLSEVVRDPHGAAQIIDRAVGAPGRATAGTILSAL